MTNSSIIKTLVENYLSIKGGSKGQPLVLDKRFYDSKNQLFNTETLESFDNKGIQFILIGDNPGDKEKNKQEYFTRHGSAGTAGNYARTFLDIAAFYHSFGDDEFQYLILNKTPFSTSSTGKLHIDSAVKDSCGFLVSALNDFANLNSEMIILIVGMNKGATLNREFYSQLHSSASDKLIRHVRFAKHFSNGNFFDQWLRHDLVGIKNIEGTTLHSTLTRIHEESCTIINEGLKLDFMTQNTIADLNEILNHAATDLKNNRIVSPDPINSLLDLSNDYSDMTLILEEELERDCQEFLSFSVEKLAHYQRLEQEEKDFQNELSEHVKNKEFENAAITRDKRRKVQEDMFQEIMKLNNFKEGFNSYKGCLLIVKPSESHKATIIEKFLKEKNIKTNANNG